MNFLTWGSRTLPLVLLSWQLLHPRAARADSIVLVPSADTTLFQTTDSNNMGASPTMIAGTTAFGFSNRALVKFDVAGTLPHRAMIQSVSLGFNVVRTIDADTRQFSLHRMLVDWGEGTGSGATPGNGDTGATAQSGESTWLTRFYPDLPWAVPGAGEIVDYLAQPTLVMPLAGPGLYGFTSSSNMVDDVMLWLTNADANFGWLLKCDEEDVLTSSRRIATREDPANAPQLTIGYTLPDRLQLEVMSVADTSLFEYQPDNNLGAAELAAGSIRIGTNRSRALVQFDLTQSLPHGAVVTLASLRVYVTRAGPGVVRGIGIGFGLHRMLRPWGEGVGNAITGVPANPGEATWFASFFPDQLWSQPGAAQDADYLREITAMRNIDSSGPWEFSNVAEDVRFWQDHPGSNYGWIVVSQAENVPGAAVRMASREAQINSPILHVDYLLPPRFDQIAVDGSTVKLAFASLARNFYTIESASTPAGGPWVTRTNLNPPEASGIITVRLPRSTQPEFYRLSLVP